MPGNPGTREATRDLISPLFLQFVHPLLMPRPRQCGSLFRLMGPEFLGSFLWRHGR